MKQTRSKGFTLFELAIVLVVVSLLAGGLMVSLGTQIEQQQRNATQQTLNDIRDALLGFAASHSATYGKPYLPCPDTDGDGMENRTGVKCTKDFGQLPWNNLGLGNQDAWGNRFDYRVDENFSNSENGFGLTTASSIKVCEQATCSTVLGTGLPVLILSHGPNGLGATTSGNVALPAAASADEKENTNGDAVFVAHTPTPSGANEFDDLLVWLSPNILYNRMIAAGRLP